VRAISEQVVLTVDQLSRLLRMPEIGTVGLVDSLKAEGLVSSRALVRGLGPWVWIRLPGRAGAPYGKRYVDRGLLLHRFAVNEARIDMEARYDGKWTCERDLHRLLAVWDGDDRLGWSQARVPDGVFETVDGVTIAVEAQRTDRKEEEFEQVVKEHFGVYRRVAYYIWPRLGDRFDRLEERVDDERLDVRRIAVDEPVFAPTKLLHGSKGDPEDWELPLLSVIAEHGAIESGQLEELVRFGASDRLGRLLTLPTGSIDEVVGGLQDRGLVIASDIVPGSRDWVWNTRRGIRLSECGLYFYAPSPRLVDYLFAINGEYVEFLKEDGAGEWVTWRRLGSEGYGKFWQLPYAVVLRDRRRYALDVAFKVRRATGMEVRVERLRAVHDGVVCITPQRQGSCMKEMIADREWSDVDWRPLPAELDIRVR
jgi:hypothetical protein